MTKNFPDPNRLADLGKWEIPSKSMQSFFAAEGGRLLLLEQAGMSLLEQAGMLLLEQAGMLLLDQAGMDLCLKTKCFWTQKSKF